MDRKEFLNKITGGIGFACVACMMEACTKEDSASGGGNTGTNPTNPGGSTALLTVNLSSQLLAIKDFVAGNNVIVVRTANGNQASSFVAFSTVCPHAGATVEYRATSNSFNCPAHNSNFSISGDVTGGPAPSGLVKKTVEISGTTLTVK